MNESASKIPALSIKQERLAVAAMLLVAAALIALAMRKPLWNNEFITLDTLELNYGGIVRERIGNNHMPGYFLALKAWTDFAGLSELSMRFISGLCGLGAVALVWGMGRWAWGARAGLAAGWIAAVNQYVLESSSQARMYSALEFFVLLSMLFYLLMLRGSRRAWIGHFATSLLALSFHLLFGMALLVQALHSLSIRRRMRARLWFVWAALLAPWAAISPLLIYWLRMQYFVGQDALNAPSMGNWLRHWLRCFWGEYNYDLWNKDISRAIGAPLMVLALGFLALAVKRAIPRLRQAGAGDKGALLVSLLPWWFLVPVCAVYASALRTNDALNSLRYYTVALACAPLVCAAAWGAMRPAWLGRVFLAGAIGLSAWYSIGFTLFPGSGLRQAVAYLAENMAPGDAVAMVDKGPQTLAFAYYGHPEIVPAGLDSSEDDSKAVMKIVDDAAANSETLWTLLHHEHDTPLLGLLSRAGSGYKRQGPAVEFGESRIYRFEVER